MGKMPAVTVRDNTIDPGSVGFVSILNGVFLNIMPEITVSFALAALSGIPEEKRHENLPAELINFGFEKSGYSCLEKLQMFNQERGNLVDDPEAAAALYNPIKNAITADARFVDGIGELLSDLRSRGVRTFTTSVVSQEQLDVQMRSTRQGMEVMPLLTEALGAREEHRKLLGHLRYVASSYPGVRKFYLLFDAPAEIRMGNEARAEFDVRVVGFAVPIAAEHVISAFEKGSAVLERLNGEPLKTGKASSRISAPGLKLPALEELRDQLLRAGADKVILYRGKESVEELRQDLASLISE